MRLICRGRGKIRSSLIAMIAMVALMLPSSLPPFVVQSFSIEPTRSRSLSTRNIIDRDEKSNTAPSIRKSLLKPTRFSSVCLRMGSNPYFQQAAHLNIRLPLLVDINDNGSELQYDVPLPNAHLPPELTTASLYELKLDVPLHRSVIQDAISSAEVSGSSPIIEESCCYGHLVYTPDGSDGLVGSIGCASEILIGAPAAFDVEGDFTGDSDDTGPLMVLARGSFRFQVKEIVKSIPYPIAIVDEILDMDVQDESDTDDSDEDGDIYDTIPSKELVKQIFQSLDKILNAEVEATAAPLSPLEQSILEDAPSSLPMEQAIQRRFDAEERIAVFQTFTSSLLDIAPNEKDRTFAVSMMAGELANLPSDVRVNMLATTDGVARLRMVLRELSSILAMDSARKITKSLSLGGGVSDGEDNINIDPQALQKAEDDQKQLQVGTPKLPSWANQIQKGIRIDYFWNEKEGWCSGTVAEDPVKIMDELIMTVKFDDDGTIHKLPFRGDEKARWRPPPDNGAFD